MEFSSTLSRLALLLGVIMHSRYMSKSSNKKTNKYLWPVLFLLMIVVIVFGSAALKKIGANSPKKTVINNTALNIQKTQDVSKNNEEKKLVDNTGNRKISFNDTNGNDRSFTKSSNWSKSSDGKNILKQPLDNQAVSGGFSMIGASYSDNIHYRLIDDNAGVLAQGNLNVVNNQFSGSLIFESNSKGGRLDVFSVTKDGVENSEVQIRLLFK